MPVLLFSLVPGFHQQATQVLMSHLVDSSGCSVVLDGDGLFSLKRNGEMVLDWNAYVLY